MPEPTLCCRAAGGYCDRCDLLVGLRVIAVERDDGGRLMVTEESEPQPMGCPKCRPVAHAHGRVAVTLVDAPSAGQPVRVVWRKRRSVFPEPACPVGSFAEHDERVARRRGLLTAPGVPLGDRAAPRRARVDRRVGSSVGHDVEHEQVSVLGVD
jgi:hypothetical protein